jgi:ssDNA-binding Zn-finger/Zn-ribbon topoisomerase 1
MALTDTAEYWWDIKNRTPYLGRDFVHIPNSTCGHIKKETRNTDTSEYLNDINCYACLKLIEENGNVYGLKEGISKRQQSAIDKEKNRFRFGKCECGSPMCERKNSKTGEKFLGCLQYPKCKKTRNK